MWTDQSIWSWKTLMRNLWIHIEISLHTSIIGKSKREILLSETLKGKCEITVVFFSKESSEKQETIAEFLMSRRRFEISFVIFLYPKTKSMYGHCCVCMCIFCRSSVFHIHVFIDKLSQINLNLMFESINAIDSQNPDGSVWSAATKIEPLLIELFLFLGRFYICCNTDSRQDLFRLEILRSEPWPLQLRLECPNEGKTTGWWGGQI